MDSQPTLSQTLTIIVDSARAQIANCFARARPHHQPAIFLFHTWILRVLRRFEHIERTRYRPSRKRARPVQAEAPPAPPRAARPRSPGWMFLIRNLPGYEYRALPTQFAHFLKDPAIAELLARDPRAVALFRGACRRLALRPEPGLPPVLFPATPRKRRERRPKPRASPQPLTWNGRVFDPKRFPPDTFAIDPAVGYPTWRGTKAERLTLRRAWAAERRKSKVAAPR